MAPLRSPSARRAWVAAVVAVLASAALIAVVLGHVGGETELEWSGGVFHAQRAVSGEERTEKAAESREQALLRQVWGLEPHGTRHIAPEESIVQQWRKPASPHPHPVLSQAKKLPPAAKHAAGKNAVGKPKPAATKPKPTVAQRKVHFGTKEQERIDSTLKRLKTQAKKLGMSFKGKKLTQLDDLPIPDLEYGSLTPDIPFPTGAGQGNKADTQTLVESGQATWHRTKSDEADPGDAKFEDAGINVNSGDTMFPDQSGDRDVDATMIYPTIQFDSPPKHSTLYAPAWSPDYLEPTRHAPTDHAAWAWIANAKKEEEMYEKEERAKLKEGAEQSTRTNMQAKAAKQQMRAAPTAKHAASDRPRHGYGSAWELPKGGESAAREQREEAIAQAWGLDGTQKTAAKPRAIADSTPTAESKEKAALSELKAVHKDEQQARTDEKTAHKKEQRALRSLYGMQAEAHQALEQVNKAETMSLAELSPAQVRAAHTNAVDKDPCPWYGCADGSDSLLAWKKQEKLKAAEQILVQQRKTQQKAQKKMDFTTDLNAKTEQLLGFPTVMSPTQKLLSHGYGTSNTFKADPITTPHDQFYGGDHHFYGSDLPVFARGEGSHEARATKSHVNAHEAYGVDAKTPIYDLDQPHSFDSVPLASPSSFLSRVEAHYPNGYDTAHPNSPGKLQAKVFRGQVLADWRRYEHGLTTCLEAESTIDPNLQDYSCTDVSTGLSYLESCMENHKFGLESLTEPAVSGPPAPSLSSLTEPAASSPAPRLAEIGSGGKGAWGALPKLVELTYQLHPKDYQTVHQVLSNSAVFDTLWNMERLHARCASTGSAVKYRTRGSRVRQIDSEVKYLDRLMKWWYPGTPEMQKGEAIIQGAYKGLPWEHASQARAAARNYYTYANTKNADASAYPNLEAENQFYGPETGYMAEDWHPQTKTRAGQPRWRVPAGGDENIANPSGPVGSLGDYTMQQPRSKLEAQGAPFPATVNGRFVDPANPRPWQADKGAYNPWTGYFWTGPGKYDAAPEAHPQTQYSTGYNYPTTVKPEVVQMCEEDVNCATSEVCSTGGFCRAWENGQPWYVPANGGIWRTDSGVAESWV